MKLTLKPNTYPIVFLVWGGNCDFRSFFKEIEDLGVRPSEISESLTPMLNDIDHIAGFRLNFGYVQAIWVKDRLMWKTVDTYAHEVLHAVWAAMHFLEIEDEEAHCYMVDYLMREIASTKQK